MATIVYSLLVELPSLAVWHAGWSAAWQNWTERIAWTAEVCAGTLVSLAQVSERMRGRRAHAPQHQHVLQQHYLAHPRVLTSFNGLNVILSSLYY